MTAIWLLPFYPSPLRDDGYDIADYTRRASGLRDARRFQALRRRRARARHSRHHRAGHQSYLGRASVVPAGARCASPARPNATSTSGATPKSTIRARASSFVDTETSNWTWDTVANAYFWHRFYAHQPDLNFDNPRVFDEVVAAHALLARPRRRRAAPRRGALPVRARRHQQREPARDPRGAAAHPRRRSTPAIPIACCSRKPTNGRRTRGPISARATNATWRSISRSCRACTWRWRRRTGTRSPTSCGRRRTFPTAASGRCSCATTTS